MDKPDSQHDYPKDMHARKPVDAVAARVISRGVSFKSRKIVLTRDSDLPLPVRPARSDEKSNPTWQDLSGRVVGRFTVLGIHADSRNQWVVRCKCGTYSTRSARAIRNGKNNVDRCEQCRHLAYLQRNDYFRQTGANRGEHA